MMVVVYVIYRLLRYMRASVTMTELHHCTYNANVSLMLDVSSPRYVYVMMVMMIV